MCDDPAGATHWGDKAMRSFFSGLAIVVLSATSVFATGDETIRAALAQRFKDDRTGACVAAAVVAGHNTSTAYYCADQQSPRRFDEKSAFEIGSVTKTMTAALLTRLITQNTFRLTDPFARLLPHGTRLPPLRGRAITLRDIVTHTSGLPSFPWRGGNAANPYAALTERDLKDALASARLPDPPGTRFQYSSLAFMLLSWALARHAGQDFETLLRERLLDPLGMRDTYIATPPPGVNLAQGHLPNTRPTVPWDFPADMAGAGGVRATLPDMVRYLRGALGLRDSAITPALIESQRPVIRIAGIRLATSWFLADINGRTIAEHGGGTGGYSSYVGIDRAGKRAVVVLSDTALTSLGGLAAIGRHLLDPAAPAGSPRRVTVAPPKLLAALQGRYRLQNGIAVVLRRKGAALTIQADGQPAFEMGYDTAGDFYPLAFDALLRPRRLTDGTLTFTWLQGGGALGAKRIGSPATTPND